MEQIKRRKHGKSEIRHKGYARSPRAVRCRLLKAEPTVKERQRPLVPRLPRGWRYVRAQKDAHDLADLAKEPESHTAKESRRKERKLEGGIDCQRNAPPKKPRLRVCLVSV